MRKLVELQNDPYSYQEISKKANDPSRHQQGAGPKVRTSKGAGHSGYTYTWDQATWENVSIFFP